MVNNMVIITAMAPYDESSFKTPEFPESEPGAEYKITIETNPTRRAEHAIEFLLINAGTISGPPDLSDEHFHYLHETLKTGE